MGLHLQLLASQSPQGMLQKNTSGHFHPCKAGLSRSWQQYTFRLDQANKGWPTGKDDLHPG